MQNKILSAICCGIVITSMVTTVGSVEANALEWSEPELSSISVYSGNNRSLEVTVPIGYEFTLDDIEDLNFKKTYESTATNLSGGIEHKYESKNVSFEDIQKDCEITTKLQYQDEITDKFVVSVNYIGDEVESVGIINSLWITIHYDINDLSCYGENYLTTDTILSVDDGEYSKDYLFNGSQTLEENPKDDTLPTIEVTEDNNNFLFDCDAFYVKAYYSFTWHMWSVSTDRKILKEDTTTSTIDGYISEIDDGNFTVTLENSDTVTYPIDADYVYIPEDIDINNNVIVIAYNTTTDDWYTNPYQVFVEPSHKVTLTGTVVSTDDGVKVKFGGFITTVPVYASIGDTVVATNFGDFIDDDWINSATFKVTSNKVDNVTIGESDNKDKTTIGDSIQLQPTGIRGDVNYDGEVNLIDLLLLKKYILQIITW